jgi:hypothetical protein
LATFSGGINRSSLLLVLGYCAFPIHIWALLSGFFQLSVWLVRFDTWDLVGVFSYLLLGALIETLILVAGLILLAWLLPGSWLRQRFALRAGSLGLLLPIWSAFLISDLVRLGWPPGALEVTLLLLFALSIGGSLWLFSRSDKAARLFLAFGERLLLLSLLYLALDIAGVFVVLVRNLGQL